MRGKRAASVLSLLRITQSSKPCPRAKRRVKTMPLSEAKGQNSVRASVSRGQSLVEFSLVGIILFMFIFGIIDAGRLLFTYSVVSNASQEGSHYGLTRPRDVLTSADATQVAQNVTRTPQPDRHTY